MYRLAVIPAAGEATRWNGMYKELLPIDNGVALIDHTVEAMKCGGADAALVITSTAKLPVLQGHLSGRHDLPLYYTIQRGRNDIWSAIEESFPLYADEYLFAMPDTLYPVDTFTGDPRADFGLGLFETSMPGRFGVLHDGRIYNKKASKFGGIHPAWGTLFWSRAVVDYWQRSKPRDYTDAINKAMQSFGYDTWPMGYYYDFASYADYCDWLLARQAQPA